MSVNSRKKMLERIRAMLNTEGRTEAEMMAFLAKARELMATYEVSEAELASFEQEAATIHKSAVQDPYEIKFNLGYAVGKFCRCEAWREKNGQRMFCGMESDVIFATWLLDTLQRFVMRALRDYQKQRSLKKMTNSNWTSASFVTGCVTAIQNKLIELTPKYETNAIVKAKMAENGIVLHKARRINIEADIGSAMRGAEAGSHARFDKPVGSGGVKYLK
jgi:hypothetical protein